MRQLRSIALLPKMAILLLYLPTAVSVGSEGPHDVKLLETWRGEVKLELRKQAPHSGFITDTESWEKLWKAYRGDEKVPPVDFTEHLILVGVNRDPNQIGAVAKLGEKGDLKVAYMGTLIGFVDPKTCAYQFAKISRKGIKSINGKPIKVE